MNSYQGKEIPANEKYLLWVKINNMRKLLFFLFILPNISFSGTLEIMNQRLSVHKETRPLDCSDQKFQTSSHALKFNLECSYKCVGSKPQTASLNEVFSPEGIGLSPGNGSGSDKIIWSSLNVGLKTWSEKICLDHSATACNGVSGVEEISLKGLRSGKWTMDSFPKCKESKITLSPFDNNAQSEKFYKLTGDLIKKSSPIQSNDYSFQTEGLSLELPINDDEDLKCDHKIVANICFGDCIDMNNKGKDFVETLATPNPLGEETMSICADELYNRFKNLKASKEAKQLICENYFWTTVMKGRITVKSCAAVRGDVNCQALIP